MNFSNINMKLCHFCGTCIGICPTNALTADYENGRPIFDKSKCIDCGKCYDNCSGIRVNFKELDDDFKGTKKYEETIGFYENCYLGHAEDLATRRNGSSGGSVTGLLVYLLEKKLVDGVIVPRPYEKKKWLFKPYILKDVEKVKDSYQSKYCLIPSNEILQELKDVDGEYAIVLLPCQIHSIRKLQKEGDKNALKLKYLFGLICGHNMEYNATKFGMRRTHIKKQQVVDVKYRDHGNWPGGLSFKLTNNEKKGINFFNYHYLNAVYLPYRCRLCPDFFVEYSDISFGDSWLIRLLGKGMDDKGIPFGWSSIISRTDKGEELLANAKKDGYMHIEKASMEDIKESFPHNIVYKKSGIHVRLKYSKPVPKYIGWNLENYQRPKRFWYHFIYNYILIFGASKPFRFMISILPLNLLLKMIKDFKRFMGYPPNARDKILQYNEKSNV